MSNKIKIFTISDHPLSPSGVGTQTKYMIEGMLKTGKYQFISFGGAVKHENHDPQTFQDWGEDWVVWPIDGYGNKDQVRALIQQQRPDILWFMTDPRFYGWLWEIENEVRPNVPMVYYHVWDNLPYPKFNKKFYDSNDHVACISKLTHDIVTTVSPDVDASYLPHAVDDEKFRPYPAEVNKAFRQAKDLEGKFVCFWNSRNARRKQSGTLIWWFNDFLNRIGRDKAVLIMHTDPHDHHGQDLGSICRELGLNDGQVRISNEKVQAEELARMYSAADLTIAISDAEGFGLSTLESLSCGTPILVTMTGGLQTQVTDGKEWFGIGLEPASKAIIGSQEVPYIYEDRLNREEFLEALTKLYEMSPEDRDKLGQKGRAWSQKHFNFNDYIDRWDKLLTKIHNEKGSWETRQGYKHYETRVY